MPGLYGNINQLYEQMNPGQSFQQGMMGYGMQTAANLPNQVMGAFAHTNAMNQAAMAAAREQQVKLAIAQAQAQSQVEAERVRQEGQTGRLGSLSPLLQQLLTGGGGLSGVSTNYGAGANVAQGSPAKPTDTRSFRGMR
jgi:hypothetical protein